MPEQPSAYYGKAITHRYQANCWKERNLMKEKRDYPKSCTGCPYQDDRCPYDFYHDREDCPRPIFEEAKRRILENPPYPPPEDLIG